VLGVLLESSRVSLLTPAIALEERPQERFFPDTKTTSCRLKIVSPVSNRFISHGKRIASSSQEEDVSRM
jgi:hypothetical protein